MTVITLSRDLFGLRVKLEDSACPYVIDMIIEE